MVCYLVFGPMLGGALCLTQRARTEQVYGSALLLGFTMKRLKPLPPLLGTQALTFGSGDPVS